MVLNVSGTAVDDECAGTLLNFPELKSLAFDYCHGITDAGIAQLGPLHHLESLSLTDCSITDEGIWPSKDSLERRAHLYRYACLGGGV